MRINYILNALNIILLTLSIVLLVPILIALIYKEYYSILPFIITSLISFLLSFLFRQKYIKKEIMNDTTKAEGLLIVALSWLAFGFLDSIPYYFFGFSFIDATFEAFSGITTTGATIFTHFNYPKTLFFFRSFSQWLGGMGIIVLFVAILPQFAIAGRQMFFAESTGPVEDKITPRIKNTATALWGLYFVLTILQIICLYLAGMPIFDSVCNSLATMAAGGFSPNKNSILGYNSNLITWIVTIFMFLAGINFALQYKMIIHKKIELFWENEEFKFYVQIVLLFTLIISSILAISQNTNLSDAFTQGCFQTLSILTSTGFASCDFETWNFSAKLFIFILMFIGGCAGSAAGGIKVVRILLVLKYFKVEMNKILHPHGVFPIKLQKNIVSKDVMSQILAFVMFYFVIFALSAVIISIIENNASIGLTSSITTLGNIGPGFGSIGPFGNFSHLHFLSKLILISNMLIGRLEIIPFLAMFHRDFWNIR